MNTHKRIAVLFSAAVHILLFMLLAAGGLFAFLQQHETVPIDVTLYQEEAQQHTVSNGNAEFVGNGQADAAGDMMEIASHTALPAINEKYTQAIAEERKAGKMTEEQQISNDTAQHITTGNYQTDAEAGNSGNMTHKGESTNSGAENGIPGIGSGTAGVGQESGKSPAHRAVLISKPEVTRYYPQELRQKGITGTVTLSVIISSDGDVSQAAVSDSSGYADMDAAAIQIAYLCRYRPAVNSNGQDVSSTKLLHIPFDLQ